MFFLVGVQKVLINCGVYHVLVCILKYIYNIILLTNDLVDIQMCKVLKAGRPTAGKID